MTSGHCKAPDRLAHAQPSFSWAYLLLISATHFDVGKRPCIFLFLAEEKRDIALFGWVEDKKEAVDTYMRILRHDQPGDGHGIRAQILFSDGQEADIPVSALLGRDLDIPCILRTVLPSAHWRAPPTELATNDITKKSFNFLQETDCA